MVGPTGFAPLDLIIMNSHERMIKTRDWMEKYNLELSDALEELGYDLEDFTGNDLQILINFDNH